MGKRANNEGSVYWDEDLKRYVGQFRYIDAETGMKKRKKITGKKKGEVLAAGKAFITENQKLLDENARIKGKITVESYMGSWLESTVRPTVRTKTYERYECNFRCHIVPGIGSLDLQVVNRAIIQDFLANLKRQDGKPLAQRTCNSIRVLLSTFFDAVVADELVDKNPVDATKPKKVDRRVIHPFTEEQYKILLAVAKKHSIRSYLVIRIAFATGFRIGEIFGLEYSDVDFQENTITIKQTVINTRHGKMLQRLAKNDTSLRTIKVEKSLIEELKKYKKIHDIQKLSSENSSRAGDFIIENFDGTFCCPAYFSDKIFKKQLLRDAKLSNQFRMHDCRHSHATWLISKGVNIKVVSERLGHKSIRTTLDIYAHVTKLMQDEAVEALEGVL